MPYLYRSITYRVTMQSQTNVIKHMIQIDKIDHANLHLQDKLLLLRPTWKN